MEVFMDSFLEMHNVTMMQVSGPGYFGTRNVADEIIDARELTDASSLAFGHHIALQMVCLEHAEGQMSNA